MVQCGVFLCKFSLFQAKKVQSVGAPKDPSSEVLARVMGFVGHCTTVGPYWRTACIIGVIFRSEADLSADRDQPDGPRLSGIIGTGVSKSEMGGSRQVVWMVPDIGRIAYISTLLFACGPSSGSKREVGHVILRASRAIEKSGSDVKVSSPGVCV